MTKIHVTLPDSAGEFIKAQVASGQFATTSEYLGFLVEQAQARAAKEKLDQMLDEGLQSGPPMQFSEAWWRDRKAALLGTLPMEHAE